jgi:excisionase family DNA binding protein
VASTEISNDPVLLDVEATARSLSIGKTKLFELIRAGELSTVAIGRRRLIPRDEVLAYVERLRGGES